MTARNMRVDEQVVAVSAGEAASGVAADDVTTDSAATDSAATDCTGVAGRTLLPVHGISMETSNT
ncbi:hypothetical protein [Rathayibacter soli]|uniref:hypothetical protein n=1 Tax=Rathayibacter soli TaxID=3144168 RepID=UPI0027E58A19|nr:hypothetical protein [Glaciibacter superstes]